MNGGEWRLRRPMLVMGLLAFGAALVSIWVPVWTSLLVCGVLLVVALAVCRWPTPAFLLLCGAVFLATGSLYQWRCVQPVTAAAGQTDRLTGRVLACPSSGHMYTVAVTDAACLPSGTRVLLYASDLAAPALGDTVTAEVSLQALADTQSHYRADGVFLLAYPTGYDENSVIVTGEAGRSVSGALVSLRKGLLSRLRKALPGEEGALLAAICLGDKTGLSDQVTEAFRRSGLSHLLVVSGLHLTMVSGSVLALLRLLRMNRRLAVAVTMGVTVAFMGLVGSGPSVLRAGVMCLVLLGGLLLRRPADGLNSLGLALAVLVGANPYAAMDRGLLLSFTATAGVLLFTPRLYACLTARCDGERSGFTALLTGFWKSVAAGVAACIGATLPLTPLLWLFFGGISLTGPAANLLAVIPAGWALLMGCLALVLLPFGPLWQGLLFLAAMPARWLLWVSEHLGFPAAGWQLPHPWQGVVLTALVGGCMLLLRRPAYVRRRAVAIFLAFTIAAGGVGACLEKGVVNVYVYPEDGEVALLLVQDDRAALLVSNAGALYTGMTATRDLGVTTLEAVAVGESRPSQAGLLAALLRQTPTEQVYTANGADWTAGLSCSPIPLSGNTPVSLCSGALLSVSGEVWQLSVEDATLTVMLTGEGVLLSGPGLDGLVPAAPCCLTLRPGKEWTVS